MKRLLIAFGLMLGLSGATPAQQVLFVPTPAASDNSNKVPNTAWVISNYGGTVSSITAGAGITLTPSPIVSTGSVAVTGSAGKILAGSTPALTATPTLGLAGTTGTLSLSGLTSGTVTIQPQSVAGTFNFNLPTAAGTAGQPLLSGGGGSAAQTYGTLALAAGGTGATDASGARTALGLGTAAVVNTGTSGATIPLLNGTNTWSGDQTINAILTLLSTDGGSGSAPLWLVDRLSASPANNDLLGYTVFRGNNASIATVNYAELLTQILDVTAGSEDGQILLSALVAGAQTTVATFANGVTVGAPTGGLQGTGTINSAARISQNANPLLFSISNIATYDPPSLGDGVGTTTTVTVTGAALGNFATVSFSLDLQGILVTAYVSATNTVAVRFQNETTGTIDLASGTLKAGVLQ